MTTKVEKTGLRHFRFWCQKVLPLVYDDSLSYYEVLCKVVEYINNLISTCNEMNDDIAELQAEVKVIQDWIDSYDESKILETIKSTIEAFIATMIFVEIGEGGRFIYYIPETWHDVTFNTTELDIFISEYPEFGRLVLSY